MDFSGWRSLWVQPVKQSGADIRLRLYTRGGHAGPPKWWDSGLGIALHLFPSVLEGCTPVLSPRYCHPSPLYTNTP